MTAKEAFLETMTNTENIVLASCVGEKPNVRIVTFGYDPANEGTIYFTTFPENQKVEEFKSNPNVTLLSMPQSPSDEVQIRIFGKVKKSEKMVSEVGEIIIKKVPQYKELLDSAGSVLLAYQIDFDSAFVSIGMVEPEKIEI